MKATEHAHVSERENVAEMKGHCKSDKEKKKSKRSKVTADIYKKGEGGRQLTGAYGEEGSGGEMDNAETKRKKRVKNKNKNGIFEMSNAEEVGGLEGDSVSGMKSDKVATKERKYQKAVRSREDDDIEVEGENAGKDVGTQIKNCEINVLEMGERKKRKREKKRRKDDNGLGSQDSCTEAKHESKTYDDSTQNKTVDNENDSEKMSDKEHKYDTSEKADRKKKKIKKVRKEKDEGDLSSLQQENVTENVEGDIESTKRDGKLERKKHKKGKMYKADSAIVRRDISMLNSVDNDGLLHTDETHYNEVESAIKVKKKKSKIVENGSDKIHDNDLKHSKKAKKKKIKSVEHGSYVIQDDELKHSKKGEKKKTKLVENGSDYPTPNKSNKKVRFSGEVEVFPLPGDSNTEKQGNDGEDKLVRGKRYTLEDDELIKESVFEYIEKHDLGDEGLDMVLNCKNYPELKGCWKEIGSAIPHRPYRATYFRAHKLFRGGENKKWTQEEYEQVLKYQKEHGNKWRPLADELGRHNLHVRNAWSRVKLQNMNKGRWSQKEYQKLFDLVNTDLQLRVFEEKRRSNHGMLRDNISWTAISDELSTRSQPKCSLKWYRQLTSPMVAEGVWADSDDYRMIGALYSLDATCMEDVEWDDLVDERSGDVCRKRWNQMLLHIGRYRDKSFGEQVEVLAQRYCPHLLEAREAWDSKPRVP